MIGIVVGDQTGTGFSPKDPPSSEFYYWDFTNWLSSGVLLVSATVTATNKADGSTATSSMVLGAASIMTGGLVVKQMLQGGATGQTYRMTASAVTNEVPPQTLALSCDLFVGPVYGIGT